MVTCTRILKCDAAHRVLGHENKCGHIHGHEYVFEVTARAAGLDGLGRVVDFSVIKARVGTWIDENWDHNAILFDQDESAIHAIHGIKGNRQPFIADWNPTAENMAQYLLSVVCPLVLESTGVEVSRVRVYETQNCFAEASLD